MCQIDKYGWKATCPECEFVSCISQIHAKKPDSLSVAMCNNVSQHKDKRRIYVKTDNDIIRPFVKF